jgi:signal transduction histidine kinase/GAF domain-containing protein
MKPDTSVAGKTSGSLAAGGRIRAPSLVRIQQQVDLPTRWTLLGLGVWVLWRTREAAPLGTWPWLIGAYALVAVITTVFWLTRTEDARGSRLNALVAYVSYVADAIFVVALIWRDGGLGSPLYILLVLLALKAVGLTPALPGMVWMPFTFGPLYTLGLRLAADNFAFMADSGFLSRYVLLWAWFLGIAILAWELSRRSEQAVELDAALVQQQAALAQKTEVLQRTATDLGDRVLELRALQEVAKALATTLRTEETLQLVVETLRDITGSSHCAVALTVDPPATLWPGDDPPATLWPGDDAPAEVWPGDDAPAEVWSGNDAPAEVWSGNGAARGRLLSGAVISDTRSAPEAFVVSLAQEPTTQEASVSGQTVHMPAGHRDDQPLRRLLGDHACLVTPLISRGQPIGALYVAENLSAAPGRERRGKLNATEQLLTSFAYFAATALENARLYQDAGEKRQELEAVLAGIGDGVVVAAPDLSLILMNPVARDILGLETAPPPGVPLRPYLSAAPRHANGDHAGRASAAARPNGTGDAEWPEASSGQGLAGLLLETLHGGQELIREVELPGPRHGESSHEDHPHTYGALASPVLDVEGDVRGVVAVLRDITAQKELERMKSNFLSVVSHELRTPLHSIKGFVEIILMGKTGPVTELQEDFLKTVRTQTTSLQRMIDDLLEFSRMEAGRVKLHLGEVALPPMAQAVAAKLAPLAEEGGQQLRVDLPDGLPEIDADRSRLEQVLTNLVENALKFTPAGGVIVISGAQVGDRVRLAVADSGIGIPPDEQDRVFDRFYQVDGSERRAYRGTGLGLSICKHIVERHNGRIWVESDGLPGHGSRFVVELPIILRPEEAPTIDFTTPARR